MDLFTAIFNRRSIRRFLPEPVEDSKLRRVMEAARAAPSWGNRQPWRLIVVTDAQVREEVAKSLHEKNSAAEAVATAPVVLVACIDQGEAVVWEGKDYGLVDAAIAMEHVLLSCTALGLATCWVSWFYENQLRKTLDLPKHYRVLGLTPIGYSAEEPSPRPRKEATSLVSWQRFGGKRE